MKDIEFRIEDWIPGEDPDPRRAATSAEFTLFVGDVSATRLLDSWSRTVTDKARLPMYPLAEWLASNWWKLHSEAPFEVNERAPGIWRMCHDLPGFGGGFISPRVRFASDDNSIQVSARALRNAPWEPVRHLNDIPPTAIATAQFDRAVDAFVESVLARLYAMEVSQEPLATIWSDLKVERDDAELSDWRRWEARLGYDPDDAPEILMTQLAGLFTRAGQRAAAEVAPLLGSGKSLSITRLEALAEDPGLNIAGPDLRLEILKGVEPWQAGYDLAQKVRRSLTNPEGPLHDGVLFALLGTHGTTADLIPSGGPLSLGVRGEHTRQTTLHFRKRHPHGQRFEAARFLAECLTASDDDTWLPQTDRATARQKFQRSFAAELLAPIAEIQSLLEDELSLESLEELGETYGVAGLAVRSHLANNGFLNHEGVAVRAKE